MKWTPTWMILMLTLAFVAAQSGCIGDLSIGDVGEGDDDDVTDDDDTGDDDDNASSCADIAELFDFESGDGGFYSSLIDTGYDDPWGMGETDNGDCHSGDICWATNLHGEYDNCEAGALTAPVFDLTACDEEGKIVYVYFWHYYQFEAGTEANYDGGLLQMSDDSGASWDDVDTSHTYTGPIEGNYSECPGDASIEGSSGWSAVIDGMAWRQVEARLDSRFLTDEFTFRFVFASDRGVTDLGWYIDDVEIVIE